ncbi:hypothetical protein QOZ88_06335 [Blastococcus sp. BMG 814]|uniref:Phage integrase family protein n=1 Tax=Blastococcus carthaginiensis TaxID=3050034 RepID=A0ABT9I9L3_9ACTN|nr:hypothetical protein [Blastococcus carthaginiensis]MDP5182249.1 hypothetical protein [Blastococcus carthaginiensis]
MLHKFFSEVLADAGVERWDQVTVALLEHTESHFAATSTYLVAPLWRYLQAAPKDSSHDQLPEEVHTFLLSPPNTPGRRTTATEALPGAMLRQVLRAAMYDVQQAEYRIHGARWDGKGRPPRATLIRRREVLAFYVLLCFEMLLSPDVIKSLSFDPEQPTSVQEWRDGGAIVTIRWRKNRGGRKDLMTLLADKEWRAGALLRRLRDASAPTRQAAGSAWRDYAWVCAESVYTAETHAGNWDRHVRHRLGAHTDQVLDYPEGEMWLDSAFAEQPRFNFLQWCQEVRKPGLNIDIPEQYTRKDARVRLTFRAIRPAAKWAKYQAIGKGLPLADLADDHTIEVLAAHYLNSEIAMRDIGEAWSHISDIAEEVARGLRPTVLDRRGQVVSGKPITAQEANRAVGDNRVGISGCRDPYNSPLEGERKGSLCGSANRACFFCRNSVVTPEDIPVLRAYLLLAENAVVTMSPPEWQMHWGRTVRWIQHVLPLMDPDWEDIPVAASDLFDLGLVA